MSEQLPLIKNLRSAINRLEAGEKLAGDELGRLVSEIAVHEIEEGGPYAASSEGKIGRADFGLNILIAYFLLLCEVDLPKLDAFLENNLAVPESSLLSDEDMHALVMKWQNKKKINSRQPAKTALSYESDERQMLDLIMDKFEKRFAGFSLETHDRAKEAIEKTMRGNSDKQMSLMAYFTRAALGRRGTKLSDDDVADMGLANIFFWTAFIIYDDFWDSDEAADPKLLPIANIFARHYSDYFSNLLPQEKGFRALFHTLMDKLDSANAWETEHCRAKVEGNIFYIPDTLPDYGSYERKYQPASGHILGPTAELVMLGYSLGSPEVENFTLYFQHYLIAMQLNDDAHDWEEDLRRGHISTVVDLLLRDLKESGWNNQTIDLDADLPEIKKIFWFTTMSKYITLALSRSTKAREALLGIDAFEDKDPLMQFADKTESIAKVAEREQKDTLEFLQVYKDI